MKALSFIFVLATAGFSTAHAACFNFINGGGPRAVGPIALSAPAEQVCVSRSSSFGGDTYTSVTFADEGGELAQFTGQVTSTGRCSGFCEEIELGNGNANGVNVDAQGTRLSFQVEPDLHLHVSKGQVSITDNWGSSIKYLVIQQAE